VRDIVTADVLQAYATRRSNVVAAIYRDFNYWTTEPTEVSRRDELHRQRRELDEEMTRMLNHLVGDTTMPPASSREWRAAVLEQQLTFLPADKRDLVLDSLLRQADNEAQMVALTQKRPPTSEPDELRRIWDTYESGQHDLGRLLTPEEYEQLQMSVSWSGQVIRGRLPNFPLSPEEFQIIFREWWALDLELARIRALGLPDPDKLDKAIYPRLREQLGEARYQEYVEVWDAHKFPFGGNNFPVR
jgi:hypothetical protein